MMMGDGTVRFARPDTRYTLPPVSDEEVDTEMIYICQAPDVRGKFDVKKAMALGVPNGPSRGLLVKGEEIEVDDPAAQGGKRIIRPEDCLVGGGPGAVSHLNYKYDNWLTVRS
jgi:ribonuclease Z